MVIASAPQNPTVAKTSSNFSLFFYLVGPKNNTFKHISKKKGVFSTFELFTLLISNNQDSITNI